MLDVVKIARVLGLTLACTVGVLGAIGAFVAFMLASADLLHNEAGLFIPPALLLFGILFTIIWIKTT